MRSQRPTQNKPNTDEGSQNNKHSCRRFVSSQNGLNDEQHNLADKGNMDESYKIPKSQAPIVFMRSPKPSRRGAEERGATGGLSGRSNGGIFASASLSERVSVWQLGSC